MSAASVDEQLLMDAPEVPAPTLAEVHAVLLALTAQVQVLTEKIENAEAQIGRVVELATPAIEQIAASPLLKMIGGKRG